MTDRPLFDLPLPAPKVIPTSLAVAATPDESLFLNASARWRDSSQGLRELIRRHPANTRHARSTASNSNWTWTGNKPACCSPPPMNIRNVFVTLTDACAFVLQHPTLETTLDQRCRVTGLNQAHALSALTPLQMLERLKDARPGTVAQRTLANLLGRARPRHGGVATRTGRCSFTAIISRPPPNWHSPEETLTAEQFKPLQLIIDPPAGALTLDNQPIHTEQLALVLSNNSRVKLTGAWVITVGDAATVSQLLYLPCRPVAIQRFNTAQRHGRLAVPTGIRPDRLAHR